MGLPTGNLKVLNSTNEEQRQLNIDKYGDKDDDVISRAYREAKVIGDVWCAKNVERYLRRFLSNSHKGNNLMDLKKAQDYMNRMVEYNEGHPDLLSHEVIEK